LVITTPFAEETTTPRIVGRSSSSFTRVTRIFAVELGVDYELQVVRDLLSPSAADYAGNPALKLPSLQAASGTWFGALNVCRELARLSTRRLRIVWPEAAHEPLLANAQELTVHALTTEVSLIMSKLGGTAADSAHQDKMRTSLLNVMSWLDAHVEAALAALPADRALSFLEVSLFCLVTHLEFRAVLPLADYPALAEFSRQFSERTCARETAYHFDP
jgi:glutathione S-transferase